MAVLAAVVGFTHLLAGFDNPALVRTVSTLLGGPYTSRQATYDLRRLKRKGLIVRLPGHHRYQLTPLGPPRRGAVHQGLRARPRTRLGRVRPKAPNRSRPPQRSGARLAPTRPTPESIHKRSTHRSLNPNLV
jgi:hypothetical protein